MAIQTEGADIQALLILHSKRPPNTWLHVWYEIAALEILIARAAGRGIGSLHWLPNWRHKVFVGCSRCSATPYSQSSSQGVLYPLCSDILPNPTGFPPPVSSSTFCKSHCVSPKNLWSHRSHKKQSDILELYHVTCLPTAKLGVRQQQSI